MARGNRSRKLTSPEKSGIQAFQENLLSLISHELRTPLTSILSSLSLVLDEDPEPSLRAEMLSMARRNAKRLEGQLSSLLELTAIKNKTFRLNLREIEWPRLVQTVFKTHQALFLSHQKRLEMAVRSDGIERLLGDPQKLVRAVALVLEVALQWSKPQGVSRLSVSDRTLRVSLEIEDSKKLQSDWKESWSEAKAKSGQETRLPMTFFSSLLESQEAFLSRTREGLGSELFLVQTIVARHGGEMDFKFSPKLLEWTLEFPELKSEEALRKVIENRVFQTTTELGTVTLVLLQDPAKGRNQVTPSQLRSALFRSTDSIYSLQPTGLFALVMDDVRPQHVEGLMERVLDRLGRPELKFGYASCPDQVQDPEQLYILASRDLASKQK